MEAADKMMKSDMLFYKITCYINLSPSTSMYQSFFSTKMTITRQYPSTISTVPSFYEFIFPLCSLAFLLSFDLSSSLYFHLDSFLFSFL